MAGYGAVSGESSPPAVDDSTKSADTAYPAGSKGSLVTCTISLSVTATLVGGQNARVDAQIREGVGAWATVASSSLDMSFTISLVTLALTHTDERTLVFFVPQGYEYKLVTSGSGSVTILRTQEVDL